MDIEELIRETRILVGQKYKTWGYHNLDHFDETVEVVRKLESKLDQRDWSILMIAVVFHDVFKGYGSGKDEEMSATMAQDWMQKQGEFSIGDLELVKEMIMGTVTTFTPEWEMHQMAEDMENPMVRLVADIDLVNMGTEWNRFESRLRGLWRECGHEVGEDKEMWQHQKNFFKGRIFLTDYIKEISPHLEENKQRVDDILSE
jgi:predicted metal-dependent HD superfamily phosphohydrolase